MAKLTKEQRIHIQDARAYVLQYERGKYLASYEETLVAVEAERDEALVLLREARDYVDMGWESDELLARIDAALGDSDD